MKKQIFEGMKKSELNEQEPIIAPQEEKTEVLQKPLGITIEEKDCEGKILLPKNDELSDLGQKLVQEMTKRNPNNPAEPDIAAINVKTLAEKDWASLKQKHEVPVEQAMGTNSMEENVKHMGTAAQQEVGFCFPTGNTNMPNFDYATRRIWPNNMKWSETLVQEERNKLITHLAEHLDFPKESQNEDPQNQTDTEVPKDLARLREMQTFMKRELDRNVQWLLNSLLFQNQNTSETVSPQLGAETPESFCTEKDFTHEEYAKTLSNSKERIEIPQAFAETSKASESKESTEVPGIFKDVPEPVDISETSIMDRLEDFKRTQMLCSNKELADFLQQCLLGMAVAEASVIELEDISAATCKNSAEKPFKLYRKKELAELLKECLNLLSKEKEVEAVEDSATSSSNVETDVKRSKKLYSKQELDEHLKDNAKALSVAKAAAVQYKEFIDALKLESLSLYSGNKDKHTDEDVEEKELKGEIETLPQLVSAIEATVTTKIASGQIYDEPERFGEQEKFGISESEQQSSDKETENTV